IINSVTVDAAQLARDPNPNNNAASVTTPILKGKIALVKTGLISADGNTITYTFIVKNTGTVALNNINLIDAKIGLNIVLPGSLAVGASTVYTKSYTLSQADKDLGVVHNTATVFAKDPGSVTVMANAVASTTVPSSPSMSLTKVATNGASKAGDLAFFSENNRVTHVGILTGDGHIIHASEWVRKDKIDENGIYNIDLETYTLKPNSIKRIIF
ncbi:MAG: hypothetical protein EOO07_12020, partial [Chitinophagaceae bacterium]